LAYCNSYSIIGFHENQHIEGPEIASIDVWQIVQDIEFTHGNDGRAASGSTPSPLPARGA